MSQVTYSNVVQGNMQKQIRFSSAHKNSIPEGCQGAKKASGAVHFVAHYAEIHLQYIFSCFFFFIYKPFVPVSPLCPVS